MCLTALCGLLGIEEPTIITCVTGLDNLYYELLFLYSTNIKLKYLKTIVILSKDQRYDILKLFMLIIISIVLTIFFWKLWMKAI